MVDLSSRVVEHGFPVPLPRELRLLLVASCHRISKARDMASKYLHRILSSFPSLLCDAALVFAILELLTLLRKACEGQCTDEVCRCRYLSLVSLQGCAVQPCLQISLLPCGDQLAPRRFVYSPRRDTHAVVPECANLVSFSPRSRSCGIPSNSPGDR